MFLRNVNRAVSVRQLNRVAAVSSATGRRSFHSPFAFLSQQSQSQLQNNNSNTVSQTSTSTFGSTSSQIQQSQMEGEAYAKEVESWAEPSGFVGKLHVVCDPDPEYTPYAVPIGAYPVSEPYAN